MNLTGKILSIMALTTIVSQVSADPLADSSSQPQLATIQGQEILLKDSTNAEPNIDLGEPSMDFMANDSALMSTNSAFIEEESIESNVFFSNPQIDHHALTIDTDE